MSCDIASLSPVVLTGGVGRRRLTPIQWNGRETWPSGRHLACPWMQEPRPSRVLRVAWLRLGVLEHDRSAVGDDLDHLAADLGSVKAQPDHRVCSKLLRLG